MARFLGNKPAATTRETILLITVIIGFCILVFIAALLAPRVSRALQRGGDKPLSVGQRAGSKAPGPLGRLLQKPFSSSRRAVSKSETAGEKTRGKLRT